MPEHAFYHFLFSGDKPWMSLVATRTHKYVRYYRSSSSTVFDTELYDTDNDPWESSSVADDPSYATLASELDSALEEHLAAMMEPLFPVDRNQITWEPAEAIDLRLDSDTNPRWPQTPS